MKINQFLNEYARPDLRSVTTAGHRCTLSAFADSVGGSMVLARIKPAHVHRFVADMHAKGLRRSTVAKHARYLHAALAHAVKMGHIETNPSDRITVKAPSTPKAWAYVDAEQMAQVALQAEPDLAAAISLCRWAGCRINEALRLTTQNVDVARRTITIDPTPDDWGRLEEGTKGKRRVVPLDPRLLQIVERGGDQDAGRICGRLMYTDYRYALQKICRWDGQPFHTLRKSCGMDWANLVPLSTVAEWMGHSVVVAAKYYLRPQEEHFAKIAGGPTIQA